MASTCAAAASSTSRPGPPVAARGRCLHLRGAAGKAWAATFEGAERLVVPIVALVEGVIWPFNAPGPEFVPAASFSVAPQGWNGRPIFYGHPMDANGLQISGNSPAVLESAIGTVFNTKVDGTRLLMEAWLDPDKVLKVGGEALFNALVAFADEEDDDIIEVSVGALVVTEAETGTFGDKKFFSVWREITPDHLAVLPPEDEGACNAEMGCGVRAARSHRFCRASRSIHVEEQEGPVEKQSIWRRLGGMLRALGWDDALGPSDQDKRHVLIDALKTIEPGLSCWIEAIYDAYVIYSAYPVTGDMTAPSKYYQRGYTLDLTTKAVTFATAVVEVEPVMHYEPVVPAGTAATTIAAAAAATTPGAQGAPSAARSGRQGEPIMTRCERITALTKALPVVLLAALTAAAKAKAGSDLLTAIIDRILGNTGLPFTEDDRAWLEGADEARLVAFAGFGGEPAAGTGDGAAAATATQTGAQVAPKTEAQFLAEAPQSIRDLVADAKARDTARKDELIKVLKGLQTEYTDVELKTMPVKDVERIARACKATVPAVDFSGLGVARADVDSTVVPPPPDLAERIRAARAAKVN